MDDRNGFGFKETTKGAPERTSKNAGRRRQKLWMAARKAELEKIVAERTLELRLQKEQVENTLAELKSTQTQLIHSEKMASLGNSLPASPMKYKTH